MLRAMTIGALFTRVAVMALSGADIASQCRGAGRARRGQGQREDRYRG